MHRTSFPFLTSWKDYLLIIVYLVLLILDLIFNGLILAAVFSYPKILLRKNFIFLISLTISDLLKFIPFSIQVAITISGHEWSHSRTMCLASSSAGFLLICVNIMNLLFENLNRMTIIVWPFRHERLMSRCCMTIFICFIWLYPTIGIIIAPLTVFDNMTAFGMFRDRLWSCFPITYNLTYGKSNGYVNYGIVITVLYFVVPSLLIGACYTKILSVSLKHIRQISQIERDLSSRDVSDSNIPSPMQNQGSRQSVCSSCPAESTSKEHLQQFSNSLTVTLCEENCRAKTFLMIPATEGLSSVSTGHLECRPVYMISHKDDSESGISSESAVSDSQRSNIKVACFDEASNLAKQLSDDGSAAQSEQDKEENVELKNLKMENSRTIKTDQSAAEPFSSRKNIEAFSAVLKSGEMGSNISSEGICQKVKLKCGNKHSSPNCETHPGYSENQYQHQCLKNTQPSSWEPENERDESFKTNVNKNSCLELLKSSDQNFKELINVSDTLPEPLNENIRQVKNDSDTQSTRILRINVKSYEHSEPNKPNLPQPDSTNENSRNRLSQSSFNLKPGPPLPDIHERNGHEGDRKAPDGHDLTDGPEISPVPKIRITSTPDMRKSPDSEILSDEIFVPCNHNIRSPEQDIELLQVPGQTVNIDNEAPAATRKRSSSWPTSRENSVTSSCGRRSRQGSFTKMRNSIRGEYRKRKREIKAAKILTGLLFTYVICYVPLFGLAWHNMTTSYLPTRNSLRLQRAILVLAFLHSSLNPIIYCLRIAEFKRSVRRLLRRLKVIVFCYR